MADLDPNCQAYSAYISETGLVDYLKWVLIRLYEEPEKPLSHGEFMKYAYTTQSSEESDYLKAEIERLTARNQELEIAAADLQTQLEAIKAEERGSEEEDY
jgi:cell division protein FtsB